MLKAFLFPEIWAAIWFTASVVIPIVWFAEVPDQTVAIARHYNLPTSLAPFLVGVGWTLVLIIPIALWSRLVW